MKLQVKIISIIILGLSAQLSFASGQRTTLITTDAIKNYNILSLDNDKLKEKALHYIGTVNNKSHILMVTKTSYSKSSSGRVGMPWSHVFEYKISVDKMNIINGWDITDIIKNESFNARPSNCPRLVLTSKQNKYVLPDIEKIKLKCLNIRRHH